MMENNSPKYDAIDSAWLEFADKLYLLAGELWEDSAIPIEPQGSAAPKVVVATLFVRTISNFKAALLLARHGMIIEARTITRCCVENLLWIGGLHSEGDQFVHRMGLDELHNRRRRANFILDKNLLAEDAQERLRKIIKQFEKDKPKLQPLNLKQVANDGPVDQLYLLYSQLSADSAHPSLLALNRYILNEESLLGIDACPVLLKNEIASTMHHLCMTLLCACTGFNDVAGPIAAAQGFPSILDEFDKLKLKTGIK
jgi:hypothetical protein